MVRDEIQKKNKKYIRYKHQNYIKSKGNKLRLILMNYTFNGLQKYSSLFMKITVKSCLYIIIILEYCIG